MARSNGKPIINIPFLIEIQYLLILFIQFILLRQFEIIRAKLKASCTKQSFCVYLFYVAY